MLPSYIWYLFGYENEDEDKPSERHLQLRNLMLQQIKFSNLHLKHVDLLDSRHARMKKKLIDFDKIQKATVSVKPTLEPRSISAKHRPTPERKPRITEK